MNDTKAADTEVLGAMEMPLRGASSAPVSGKHLYATLVRGELHYYNDKFFKAGEPVLVTEDEKAHLEEFAVDNLSIANEEVIKQKFRFEEKDVSKDTPTESKSPFQRRKVTQS